MLKEAQNTGEQRDSRSQAQLRPAWGESSPASIVALAAEVEYQNM